MSDRKPKEAGQATVEAAFLIPILLLTFMLLIQPAILLYVRMVMEGAAAEGCRILTTESSLEQGTHATDDFIKRRLAAVPQQENFHVHNDTCSWSIEKSGSESEAEACVKITGEVKPLPLFDFGMAALGILNENGNFELRVEHRLPTKSSWLQNNAAGSDPTQWVNRWKS